MSAPDARDQAVRRTRAVTWASGLAAIAATATLSVEAAHAFKGHHGGHHAAAPVRPAVTTSAAPSAPRVHVPPPEHIPAIVGQPAPPPPPPPVAAPAASAAPPAAVPAPVPEPAPVTSSSS